MNSVQASRIRKTKLYLNDKDKFSVMLYNDVVKFINIGENTYNDINEVTKDSAKKMIKVLNTYQNGSEIPEKVKGYNINWR